MRTLYKPKDLLDYLSKNKIKPKKTLSQNFLIDKNIIDKVLHSSNISKDEIVLEIGSGLGALTFEIAKKAKKVIAVEMDDIFAKNLKDQKINNLKINNLNVYNKDFLKFDLEFLKRFNKKIKVISSVPYHLTSLIITKLLKHHFLFSSIVLIIQKEVAEKILSNKDSKKYGYFSIFVNFYTEPKILANISKSCFFPMPKVDSSIIELKIKNEFLDNINKEIDIEKFLYFVKTAFSQRRKKLLSSIKNISSKEKIIKIFNDLNIDENVRAENLSLDNFLALYKKLF
ncbi:MAG: Ribosomal RNA small subunit methyltransferase A [Candidatus Anoxychlamydiales bacterium]|nr:Ribosomal RNA small subunit methyltransferase A [Candidatus Anoxychlamydiales bacterium]